MIIRLALIDEDGVIHIVSHDVDAALDEELVADIRRVYEEIS